MKHKELNIIFKVFDSNGEVKFLKYRGVTNLNNLINYTLKAYSIDYINIYDKKTKERIKSLSFNEYKQVGLFF